MAKKNLLFIFFLVIAVVVAIFIMILLTKENNKTTENKNQIVANHDEQENKNINLSLEQVLNNADYYNNKTITIDCYYLEAFETNVLAKKINNNSDGSIQVIGGDVWVSWQIDPPKDLLNMLNKAPSFLGTDSDLYGRVKVGGDFKKMKESGHLGNYDYIFEIYSFRVYNEELKKFVP